MPHLEPFRALRYAADAGPAADLIAPPYDVIGEAEAADLRRRHVRNAVHLVLPEGPAPARYEHAARRLRAWRAEGILVEEREPAAFVYRQRFESGGEAIQRRSLFAALELSPFERGEVLPHEATHGGPKRDRLALTLACRAQLSAVFLTAPDPEGRLLEGLREEGDGTSPVLDARTGDGVAHELWRVTGARARDLCAAAGERPLLIADGHHRYETALAARRRLPHGEGARVVLACVASEADPGLRVLPTHRALRGEPPEGGWPAAIAAHFDRLPSPQPAGGAAALAGAVAADREGARGPARLGFFLPARREGGILLPRHGPLRATGLSGAEQRVASLLFDRLVLGAILGTEAEPAHREGALVYEKDPARAAHAAGARGAVFLLPPVRLSDVRRLAAAGRRLPPKSTYFDPKVPSGLLFRRI